MWILKTRSTRFLVQYRTKMCYLGAKKSFAEYSTLSILSLEFKKILRADSKKKIVLGPTWNKISDNICYSYLSLCLWCPIIMQNFKKIMDFGKVQQNGINLGIKCPILGPKTVFSRYSLLSLLFTYTAPGSSKISQKILQSTFQEKANNLFPSKMV